MRAVVGAAKVARVDVAVGLRRREGAVAEELLDRPEVGAAVEQVCCERVTEAVRVRGDAAQRGGVEAAPARGEEEGVVCSARQLGAGVTEVAREPVLRLFPEWHDAMLRALAVA